jgi:uncharacterized protein with PIN domain
LFSLFGALSPENASVSFELQLACHGDLADSFLPPRLRSDFPMARWLREKTAIKDVIEACGVPHPEVDLIVVSHQDEGGAFPVDLRWQVVAPARIDVYGVPAPPQIFPSAPRLQTRHFDRFVTDGHLGKLARNLRLLGLDTSYAREADDRFLLRIMAEEDRALLTRDRRLLMHSVVRIGYCPRSADPEEQTAEVLRRFGLLDPPNQLAPFTRCAECNGFLKTVPKTEVLERLSREPLTLLYYDEYRMCSTCSRIYWAGSHFRKLARRVHKLLGHSIGTGEGQPQ